MKKITTDNALKVSALILLVYTIICIVLLCLGKQTDSTLTACIFASFGVAEGGYCTYIHKIKKDRQRLTAGDTTGFDDAELLDEEPKEENEGDVDG